MNCICVNFPVPILLWAGGLFIGFGFGYQICGTYTEKEATQANVAYYDSKTGEFKWKVCE